MNNKSNLTMYLAGFITLLTTISMVQFIVHRYHDHTLSGERLFIMWIVCLIIPMMFYSLLTSWHRSRGVRDETINRILFSYGGCILAADIVVLLLIWL
jgi:uncharacterized membrane protein YhaH (DUF805 family)